MSSPLDIVFLDIEIPIIHYNGSNWVPLKFFSKVLELDYKTVCDRVNSCSTMSNNSVNLGSQTSYYGILEPQLYLNLSKMHGYLFICIQPEEIKAELRQSLIMFREDCCKALTNALYSKFSVSELLPLLTDNSNESRG